MKRMRWSPRNTLLEHDNFIVYNGRKLDKPFVEKPEDADRHDIYIYYPPGPL